MRDYLFTVSSAALSINFYLFGYYSGARDGYYSALQIFADGKGFGITGVDSSVVTVHLTLGVLFAIFEFIKLATRRGLVSSILSISVLLMIGFVYVRWFGRLVLNSELTLFDNVIRNVGVLDCASVVLVVGLLIPELLIVFRRNKEIG